MNFFDRWTDKLKKKNRAEMPRQEQQQRAVPVSDTDVQAKKQEFVKFEKGGTLIAPIVSERAAIAESFGTYTFEVAKDATKYAVKQAVAKQYHVHPVAVRMVNVEGKRVRSGRFEGKRSDWKKAMVTLSKGERIQIHEGV